MKKILTLVAMLAMLAGCNSKKAEEPAEKKEEKKAEGSITYPYKPVFSNDFKIGDPNHVKIVLDFLKLWEDNKVKDMRVFLTDTVSVDFPDGNKFRGTADSLVTMGENIRSKFSDVKLQFYTWVPLHMNDTNEDWVMTWFQDWSMNKDGKKDSMDLHTVYQIKNNKISYWGEFQATPSK